MKNVAGRLLVTVDLAGTALFALEGARTGMGAGLDALGVLVLAFVTALAGGLLRDVLIGDIPPAALRDWRYTAVALAGGAAAFLARGLAAPLGGDAAAYLDAAGLGLFAVAGAQKASAFGLHPLVAVAMGGITGAGGGALRDVLLARIPLVLHADVYATAALAGATVMLVSRTWGLPQIPASALGAVVCFALRVAALERHWNLPSAGLSP